MCPKSPDLFECTFQMPHWRALLEQNFLTSCQKKAPASESFDHNVIYFLLLLLFNLFALLYNQACYVHSHFRCGVLKPTFIASHTHYGGSFSLNILKNTTQLTSDLCSKVILFLFTLNYVVFTFTGLFPCHDVSRLHLIGSSLNMFISMDHQAS